MSQLSQMSPFFQISSQTVGRQRLLDFSPKLIPYNHHTTTSSVLVRTPQTHTPIKSSARGDSNGALKNPKNASCEGGFELQSLCVGNIIFWADKMANHEPPSSSAMQDGSCCSTRPHLLPRAAILSTAMQNGSHSSSTSHFSPKPKA